MNVVTIIGIVVIYLSVGMLGHWVLGEALVGLSSASRVTKFKEISKEYLKSGVCWPWYVLLYLYYMIKR